MVQGLVLADWFLPRVIRPVTPIEAQLLDETPKPLAWTDQPHKILGRFLRYQTTRSNAVKRCRKAIEDFLGKRECPSRAPKLR
jgi:hypothetical protein